MKFKVGDKVRIIKDLNLYNDYDNCGTVSEMLEYKGDIATIMKVFELSNCYKINVDNQQWHWTDEMFEPVEEAIEYKGKKYDVYKEIDCDNNKFNKVLQLKEVKEEILDEEEKEYLNNVIKYVVEPTHNEIYYISKEKYSGECYFINIHFKNIGNIPLPDFKDKRMYKGMKLNEIYTLEKLGLEE